MARAKQVRWECPNGLHPGKLGSTRPRKNATVCYCLPCSEEAGVLVERTAPALERKRAAKTATRETKQRAARERAAAERVAKRQVIVSELDHSAGVLDVEETAKAMWMLPELVEQRRESGQLRPRIVVRRSRTKGHSSGHSKTYEAEVVLTIGSGAVGGPGPDRETVEELILHELVHAALPVHEWHGKRFRSALLRAARQWWPGIEAPANEGAVYDLDWKIVAAALKMKRAKIDEEKG